MSVCVCLCDRETFTIGTHISRKFEISANVGIDGHHERPVKFSVFGIGGIFGDRRKIGYQWVSCLDPFITQKMSLLYS